MAEIPTVVVDVLPERLWFYGNLYRVFGRDVHFCVADGGLRTVEVDGDEVGRGRPIGDVPDAPEDPRVVDWLGRFDLGWVVSAALLGLISVVTLARRPSRD